MKTLLTAENLQIGFRRAINPTPWNFSLEAGKTIGLIGPNGAGKTTLLLTLMGYLARIAGTIRLGDSQSIDELTANQWPAWFSLLPQEQPYRSEQTVDDHLRLAFISRLGLWSEPSLEMKAEMDAWLVRLAIQDLRKKRLGELSSGERQRVFLARTLLQNSRIVLLDEPTNHLDPEGTEAFWSIIQSCSQNPHRTILISTHDLAYVKSHCQASIAISKPGSETAIVWQR